MARGKLPGTAYERADGRWEAALTVGVLPSGNPRRERGYFPTRREADAWRLKRAAELHLEGTSDPTTLTVLEWAEEWLETRARLVRPNTLADYTKALKAVVPQLGRTKLRALSAVQVNRALAAWHADGMSAYATRKNLRTLRMCLEDAVRLGMIPKNPAKAVRGPKVEPKPILVWTGEEAERALEQAKREAHRLHAFLHLNLTTGLRREEMLGLRWQDVDLERGSLKVVQACTYLSGRPRFDRPKSRAGRRTISLDEGTTAVVRAWRSRLALERAGQERRGRWTDFDLVFPSTVGTPFNEPGLGPALRGIMARAGVPRIRAYDLRHSYASLAYEAGVPIKLIGERMGHANVAFTLQTYVHSNEQQRRAAALGTVELFGSRVRAERASAVSLPSNPVEPN